MKSSTVTTTSNSTHPKQVSTSSSSTHPNTTQAGNAGTFLRKACEDGMDEERLIGSLPRPPRLSSQDLLAPSFHLSTTTASSATAQASAAATSTTNHDPQLATPYQNLVSLSKFLATYRAQKVLEDANSPSQNNSVKFYLSAVDDFAQTQIECQNVGLRTNPDDNKQDVSLIVSSHKNALNVALLHAENSKLHHPTFEFPKKEFLFSWHALMCPKNRQSGMYRMTESRDGHTVFCPSTDIAEEMSAFADAMDVFYNRWSDQILMGLTPTGAPSSSSGFVPDNGMSGTSGAFGTDDRLIKSTYYGVALAAIMLYGVSDIHPYSDGNGRMARLCTNWILRRVLGLPFSVNLTATSQHRADYVSSLKSGLLWIQKTDRPDTKQPSDNEFVPGIFQRIIFMLLDRIAHAVYGCEKLVATKARAATAIEEARIARVVRARAAAQPCTICLEDNPNILTICCGHAVHLNCLAEWLATASTCVACRKPFPGLQLPGSAGGLDDEDDMGGRPVNAPSNPRNDIWNAVLTNMLWEAAEAYGSDDDSVADETVSLGDEFSTHNVSMDSPGNTNSDPTNSDPNNDSSNIVTRHSLQHALMGNISLVVSNSSPSSTRQVTSPNPVEEDNDEQPQNAGNNDGQ